MSTEKQFSAHLKILRDRMDAIFGECTFEALVIHSGTPRIYFADDHEVHFHPTPHFAHWTPMVGPGHLLCLRPCEKPCLVALCPKDYWSEPSRVGNDFWCDEFDIREVSNTSDLLASLPVGRSPSVAFYGDDASWAIEAGFANRSINPAELIAPMDWNRSFKTPYEIARTQEASESAARGFRAAESTFRSGGSELEIHHAFVKAVGCTDNDLAFPSIVAHDSKSAILHYPNKRADSKGDVCLVDAGAKSYGYSSDITRTYTKGSCPEIFRRLVDGMNRVNLELGLKTTVGTPFAELHSRAHVLVGDLLCETGVLKLKSGETAFERGITKAFFPHGLGHFLGLQVHDVSGHQRDSKGGVGKAPEAHPALRTTRTLEDGHLVTIEPGLYFIEMLLEEHRNGPEKEAFDWSLIETLIPFGGIRVEDDIVVRPEGPLNLTRPYLP